MRKKTVMGFIVAAGFALSLSPTAMALNPSQASAAGSVIGSAIVLSPLWAPFYGSVQVIEDSQYTDVEKDAAKYTVKDQYGKQQTLYVPREVEHRVNIRHGDQIDLEPDGVGVLMKKSGEPAYYFIPKSETSRLGQHRLK